MFQDVEGKMAWEARLPQTDDYLVILNEGKVLLTEEGFLPTLAECGLANTVFGKYGIFSTEEKVSSEDILTAAEESGDFARLQYLLTYEGKAFYTILTYGATSLFFAGDVCLEYQVLRTLFVAKDQVLHFAAATACHLAAWYRDNRYCGSCTAVRLPADDERALVCPVCGHRLYPAIAPVIIVGVLYEGKILMTRYADPRGYRHHALVAGFCEVGESFEAALQREVYEEAGLHVTNITYYKSQPWAFSQSLLAGFFCKAESGEIILNTDGKGELSEALWVAPEDIALEDNDLALTWTMIRDFKADPERIMKTVG